MLRLTHLFNKSQVSSLVLPFKQYNYLNTLEQQALTDILHFSEQRIFLEMAPDAAQKKVLFISQSGTELILDRVFKMNSQVLLHYSLDDFSPLAGSTLPPIPVPRLFHVRGTMRLAGVKRDFFDIVYFPCATGFRREFVSRIPQISHVMANGGRALCSFIHPSLELFLYNQNPASPSRTPHSLQDYFAHFKQNDLYLEGLVEGVVDKDLKPFFNGKNGANHFEEFRGMPLILFLRVVKFVKG